MQFSCDLRKKIHIFRKRVFQMWNSYSRRYVIKGTRIGVHLLLIKTYLEDIETF